MLETRLSLFCSFQSSIRKNLDSPKGHLTFLECAIVENFRLQCGTVRDSALQNIDNAVDSARQCLCQLLCHVDKMIKFIIFSFFIIFYFKKTLKNNNNNFLSCCNCTMTKSQTAFWIVQIFSNETNEIIHVWA